MGPTPSQYFRGRRQRRGNAHAPLRRLSENMQPLLRAFEQSATALLPGIRCLPAQNPDLLERVGHPLQRALAGALDIRCRQAGDFRRRNKGPGHKHGCKHGPRAKAAETG